MDPSAKVIGGIEASGQIQGLLEKVRTALGGQQRLLGVRSLAVEGIEQFEGSKPRPLSQLLLLPDRFQETYVGRRFTINGKEFWQAPEPSAEVLRTNSARYRESFAAQCLLFLVRGPAGAPLVATEVKKAVPGSAFIALDGPDGFHRELELDSASMRPKAFAWKHVVTQGERKFEGLARLVIDEYKRIDDIWFPVRTTSRQEGVPIVLRYEYSTIRVDQGVQLSDFVQQK